MPTTINLQPRIGSSSADAAGGYVAIDSGMPYVDWTVPPGIHQRRFSIRIESAEAGGFAYQTSGEVVSSETHFQFPPGIAMNSSFSGLCRLIITVSESTGGAFEYVGDVSYFVYDQQLERIFNATEIAVDWLAAPDPDSQPLGYGRFFHLQIATTPLFTTTVYDNSIISSPSPTSISMGLNPGVFSPEPDTTYYYRVAQSDGMDWSAWSRVNAFINYLNVPPTISINSVVALHDGEGTMLVTFTLADLSNRFCSVMLSFLGGQQASDKMPLTLLESTVSLPPGTYAVQWRSREQVGLTSYSNYVLYGYAVDDRLVGHETSYGPIVVDNTYLEAGGGGIGSKAYRIDVVGALTKRNLRSIAGRDAVAGILAPDRSGYSVMKPVSAGPQGWASLYLECPFEKAGGEFYKVMPGYTIDYPPPMDQAVWSGLYSRVVDYHRMNPHATSTCMLFPDPNNIQSDGWARPVTSRDLGTKDDPWIQIAMAVLTEHPPCPTCHGRGKVVSGTGPYTLVKCSNPICNDGADTSQRFGPPTDIHRTKIYYDAAWYRLSVWNGGRQYQPEHRYGWDVARNSLAGCWQHIVGKQLGQYDRHTSSFWFVGNDPPIPYGVARPWTITYGNIPLDGSGVTRQPRGSSDVAGRLTTMTRTSHDSFVREPVEAGHLATTVRMKFTKPVAGNILHGKTDFYMGGVNPNSKAAYAGRPPTTQPGSIRITGQIHHALLTKALSFIFMSPFWDAYNTIHLQATASETSELQVQFARYYNDGSHDAWNDLQGDNAHLDAQTGTWLVNPLVFDIYWNTIDQGQFVDGASYRMRVRQYDLKSRSFNDWVYSSNFMILHGFSNPISMLSLTYEPFTGEVTVIFRVDDTQMRPYTITKSWYSDDDGQTWNQIAPGDIHGDTTYLSSDRTDGGNIHTLIWSSRSYNPSAGDNYRLQIEAIPSDYVDNMTLPFFKWLTPLNPSIDAAEIDLIDIQGGMTNQYYDSTTNQWITSPTMVYVPGKLASAQKELAAIQNDPGPSGMYAYLTPSGTVADQGGYNSWLHTTYLVGETHGAALQRVSAEIDYYANTQIPQDQAEIQGGEIAIRKRLIDQGYYVEENFLVSNNEVEEAITASPISNDGSVDLPSSAVRWWRFRVQNAATGGDNLTTVTNLESTYYKFQLDNTLTFNSQLRGHPMREVLFDETGRRITMAQVVPILPERTINPVVDSARQQVGDLSTSIGGPPTTLTFQGTVKLLPASLPGEQPGDIPPVGQTTFDGTYNWRVAAYNALLAPINAQPRPLITSLTMDAAHGTVDISFVAQAHPDLLTITLDHSADQYGNLLQLTGYQVSNQTVQPYWTDLTPLNFVSDCRAPIDSPTGQQNTIPWIYTGTNRPHPFIMYDDDLGEYLIYNSKIGWQNTWRVSGSRAMALPKVCEYAGYFNDDASAGLYRPWVVKAQGFYWMYVTSQPGPGLAAQLLVTTSTDGDQWSYMRATTGISDSGDPNPTEGIHPTVLYKDNLFHMWYAAMDEGVVKIFYVTSTDGINFTPVQAGAAYTDAHSVGCPSVLWLNGSYVMYFNDQVTGQIASVVSADGKTFTGRQNELSPTTIVVDEANVAVTPQNPCVYVDRFGGNLEVFMAFNYLLGDGTNLIYTVRLENRLWVTGVPNMIFGAAGALVNAASSDLGVAHACTIDLVTNHLQPTDTVKVRLFFPHFTPAIKEYHRQSDWVRCDQADQVSVYMDPTPWYYNSQLRNYPYMKGVITT